MKRLLCGIAGLVVLACLSSPGAHAENNVELGGKLGLNFTTLTGELPTDSAGRAPDNGYKVGGHIGAILKIGLNDRLAVRAEVLFSMKGSNWELSETLSDSITMVSEMWTRLNYFEVPILIQYTLPTEGKLRPFFYAGPAIAFNGDSEAKTKIKVATAGNRTLFNEHTYYNRVFNVAGTQFEAVFGGGVEFGWGTKTVAIEGRYTMGLQGAFDDFAESGTPGENEMFIGDITTGAGADVKHGVFTVTFGLNFPI